MPSIFDTEKVNVDNITAGDALQAIYLDWINNFLTVARFAEYYGLDEYAGAQLIDKARDVHESRVERMKLEKSYAAV